MMDSQGEQYKITNDCTIDKVTSLGNAWVICRSKSYSGRVYYFNTLTGEAAWNLSDAEVEKAKKQTDSVRLQAVGHLDNCPEPKEPPVDQCYCNCNRGAIGNTRPDHVSPKIYNKQIINNSFAKSTHAPYVVAQCNNCNSFKSSMPSFNPNVWSVPSQPCFVAPTVSSVPQQSQTPVNIPNHNMQHVSFPHPTRGFAYIKARGRNIQRSCRGVNHFSARVNRMNFGPKRNQQFIPRWPQNRSRSCDLRNVLTSRRKSMESGFESQGNAIQDSRNSTSEVPDNSKDVSLSKCTKQELCNDNEDDQWLKENCICENGKFKIDVTALKNLTTKYAESENWYIVVDKNMVLNHYNILHIFINSDRQCRLVVARDVLSQLQATARTGPVSLKERARRALRFLSQQFAADSALIGEHSINSNEMNEGPGMINFCLKLAEQNNHVILLSDNELLQTHQQSKVNVFSLNEMKEFLTNDLYKESYFKTLPILDRTITVTIPNQQANNATSMDEIMEISNEEIMEPQNNSSNVNFPKTRECNVQTEGFIKSTKMVDSAVQTDFTLEELSQNLSVQKPNVKINTIQGRSETVICENTDTSEDTDVNVNLHISQNEQATTNCKKREIRLNRSTCNQTSKSVDNNVGKKHFKWHRRKKYGSCSDNAESTVSNNEESELLLRLKHNPLAMSNESLCKSVNDYEDIIENSDTSSCIYMHRNVTQNIIIEETSTSDVISNSASTVYSEIVQQPMVYNNVEVNYINDIEQSKNVMFEITSPAMEKHLQTRCDEWMSRFVQIMEEALTQLLQNELQFSDSAMPPPWTLHEATQCIKKSFPHDSDVTDATTKLSQVIFSISDEKGRLSVDIKPAKFMELYSYGVYLVDALQSIFEDCYDLQAAAESLATLLSDIQTPNSGHNESFGDHSDEPSLVVSMNSEGYKGNQNLRGDDKIVQETVAVHESPASSLSKTQSPQSLQSNKTNKARHIPTEKNHSTPVSKGVTDQSPKSNTDGKYNLRSNRTRSEPDVNQKDISQNVVNQKFINSKEVNQKKDNQKAFNQKKDSSMVANREEINRVGVNQNEVIVKFIRNIDNQSEFFSHLQLKRNTVTENAEPFRLLDQNINGFVSVDNKENNDSTKEPHIIRNFTKCLDIEERLKSKAKKSLDLDMLDYSMNHDDVYDDFMEYEDEDETDGTMTNTEIDVDRNYKLLLFTVMEGIREATIRVHEFCEKVRNELCNSQIMNYARKQQIYDQAGEAHSLVTSLCESLKSMLKRELNLNGKTCQTLLKEAGFLIEDRNAVYTTMVASCIKKGNTLLEAINFVKDAVQTTNGAILE